VSQEAHVSFVRRNRDEDGIAVPTALMAILILLMLGGLFVSHGVGEQRATRGTQAFEGGLHVAETAAEVAIAALADPAQPAQPFIPSSTAPATEAGAKQWAIDQALTKITSGCGNFQRTAGGDGIAVVDDIAGTVYGVSFLPNCTQRTTTRVLRVSYDQRPTMSLPSNVSILAGGNVHLDQNSTLTGGIHTNGNLVGTFGDASGGVSAGGTCVSTGKYTCTAGAPQRNIPNYTARSFWDVRNTPEVNPNNDPFYELCPDGLVRINSVADPCTGTVVPKPHSGWVFSTEYTWPNSDSGFVRTSWGPTWRWTQNFAPPPAVYYGYRTNVVSNENSGMGTSGRFTVIAEADRVAINTNGAHSGSVGFTASPKFFAAWQGVGIVADVDVVMNSNISAFGSTTLVFAREQFHFIQNGSTERIFFVACDAALTSTTFDPEAPACESAPGRIRSSSNSPVDTTRIRKNTSVQAPGDGTILTPNLGLSGVGNWQVL
jgi:hypothetical protein